MADTTRNILTGGTGAAIEAGDEVWRELARKLAPMNETARQFLLMEADAVASGAVSMEVPVGTLLPSYQWWDAADIPRLQWLLGHWILRGAVTKIAAAGGLGKTAFTIGMALSMASGRPLLGKPLYSGAQRVAVWNLEDDQEQLARGIAAASIRHGVGGVECEDRLIVASALGGMGLPPLPLMTATQDDRGFHLEEEEFARVADAVNRLAVDVLIIDPFVSSHAADENSTAAMDRIVKRWALLAKQCGCAVVLVHHLRKTNGERADIDAVRGSIASVNAARAVLLLNRMTEAEAAAFQLGDDERRRMFCVDLAKANRSAPEKIEWYRLDSVALGNGGDEAGDEVGAVVPWASPEAEDGLSPMQIELARAVFANGEHRADARSKRWGGHALGEALGIESTGRGAERLKLLIRAWKEAGKLVSVVRREPSSRKEFEFLELGPADWLEGSKA